ncbi:MAG: phosphopyruvate hydratase, partial [Elusimicrobiales bacterium]|nr:phosphopyruvate hydratase [Elusimicrobiales bacterium]
MDSRGNPTIETRVELDSGIIAKASVPSGASTGVHEAWELRDNDKKRYNGKGVLKAVNNVNTKINKALTGINCGKQEKIDEAMIKLDGTKNKKKLGANAILSVSLASARAGARANEQKLYEYIRKTYKFGRGKIKMPTPSFNIFNGGTHADTNLDFQEFMVLPLIITTLAEKVRMGAEIFHELGHVLKAAGLDTDVGNEGGYAPDIHSSIQALEFISAACLNAGYQPGKDIGFGIDVGSSELYNPK